MTAELANHPRDSAWKSYAAPLGGALAVGVLVWKIGGGPTPDVLATSALWLAFAGAVIIAVLHFVVPKLDPNNHFVSEYARDHQFGWLMNLAFVWLGIASFALGGSILLKFQAKWLAGSLALAGASIALLSVFVTAPNTRYRAIHGTGGDGIVHDVLTTAGFALITVSMALFAVFPPVGFLVTWHWTRAVALSQFNLTLVVVIAQLVLAWRIRKGHSSAGLGLTERALILSFFEWVLLLGFIVLRT